MPRGTGVGAPLLVGPRVMLRPLCEADVEGNYPRWFNDPEVCRFNRHGTRPYGRAEALAYVRAVSRRDDTLVLAIVDRQHQVHIGNVSLQSVDLQQACGELAILVGEKDYWGRGYAKEASRLLVHYGFERLGLRRIYCGTRVDNLPMQHLAAALGMALERIEPQAMEKDGRYYDVMVFSLSKPYAG